VIEQARGVKYLTTFNQDREHGDPDRSTELTEGHVNRHAVEKVTLLDARDGCPCSKSYSRQ
jgi:hypothetical protein